MSAQRLAATAVWTQLVIAMRADGILSEDITQSGPATTAAILELCKDEPWFPMTFKPASGHEVLALHIRGGLYVIKWSSEHSWWADSEGRRYGSDAFSKWTFVRLPK